MTNEMIILEESVRLMNEGVLAGTGKFITVENKDGTKKQLEIPKTYIPLMVGKREVTPLKKVKRQ